jgi:hypothetical protein
MKSSNLQQEIAAGSSFGDDDKEEEQQQCSTFVGKTPLHCALSAGHVDIAKLLIAHGARCDVDEVSAIAVETHVVK